MAAVRAACDSLNLLAFVSAAVLEIAGCFASWMWLRQGRSPAIALLGVLSLAAFAWMLTRVDVVFAGRAYAAYGGIYIAASLGWLWVVEGQVRQGLICSERFWRLLAPS